MLTGMRGKITVTSVLIGVAATGACSDEDSKKNTKGGPDAGADGSLAGDGGSAGSSAGTGGTTGGTGGAAGSGGASGATSGGTGGDAGTGGMSLVCNLADAGATGGSAGQGAGGTSAVGQWRDWDAWQCRDCPSPLVSDCVDFDEAGSSTFNQVTRIFTLRAKASTIDVVSATYNLDWGYDDANGMPHSGTSTGSFDVDQDTLSADLSSSAPTGDLQFYQIRIRLTDACGKTTTVDYGVWNPPTGSQPINIHCEM